MNRKIVFHIIRQNWYRVLAAPIAEALRRGWEVECWHATYSDGVLGENLPRIDRVPKFECGCPSIVEYKGKDGICELVNATDAHIIVDIEASPVAELCEGRVLPLTVLLDGLTHPILSRLQSSELKMLPFYDVFALPSIQQQSGVVNIMSQDHDKILSLMQKQKISGINYFQKWLSSCWTPQEEAYFLEHSFVIGTPSFDDIKLIDPSEVKRRWELPLNRPVVGLLPSPWDMPVGLFCGDLNTNQSLLGVIKTIVKYKKYSSIVPIMKTPRNKHILKAIRKFCDFNDALLITKLRHSRKASGLLTKITDKIIGEDGYYPHSALEFFSVADVVFGFTSSGVYECVAADCSYIDIDVPFFPKEFYIKHIAPSLSGTESWPGVVWASSAESIVGTLPVTDIKKFQIDEFQRKHFLSNFSTNYDGFSSARFLDTVEEQINIRAINSHSF